MNSGDQILAIDGYRASLSFLEKYIGERKPGDRVRLTVFRFDKMRDIELTLGSNTRADYSFVPVENPTSLQRRLYQDYLRAELSSLGK